MIVRVLALSFGGEIPNPILPDIIANQLRSAVTDYSQISFGLAVFFSSVCRGNPCSIV